MRRSVLALTLFFAAGCGNQVQSEDASTPRDSGEALEKDASITDTGTTEDAGSEDAGFQDAESMDAIVPVDAGLPPEIGSFTATPNLLPPGGGMVVLAWSVTNADSISIDNGIGDVTGMTSVNASVTASTTFTLTATNDAGSVTATAAVETGALFVDPANGNDNNPGTLDEPLSTITRAAQLAESGDTIWLLDGTHEIRFVNVADGVTIRAVNTGVPRVQLMPFSNGAFVFSGSGRVHGIHVNSGGSFGFFQVSNGELVIEETHYTAPNGLYPLVDADGTARVRMIAPSDGEWCVTECNTPFAAAVDNATISIEGGRISGFSNVSTLIYTAASGRIFLRDVTIENGAVTGNVISLSNTGLNTNTSTVVLERSTIRNATLNTNTVAIHVGFGSGHLELIDSAIEDNAGVGIDVESGGNYSLLQHTVTLVNSRIERNLIGVRFYLYARARFTMIDSVIAENAQNGIQCVFTAEGCRLDISGGAISNNGVRGIDTLNDYNKALELRLRGVSITGNAGHGLYLDGLPGSTYDLGTDADPGMNIIRDNGSASAGLYAAGDPADVVWAVGNTWIPGEQGADTNGRYVPTSGNYVEITGPVSSGTNHQLVGAVVLRL